MWTLEQLQTFKLAAEQKNFSRVGKNLGISAAAVGKQIKLLEDAVGAQLFYRTTRHVSLTELGEAFYEQSARILAEIDKTKDVVSAHKGEVQGKLKIISSLFFGEHYIVPHLATFIAHYSQLTIDLELADRIADIEMENIDLLIGLMAGLPPHYAARLLKKDRYLFCASPNFIKQYGEPKTPHQLENFNYITHSKRPQPNLITFDENTIIHVKPHLTTNNTAAMLQWCRDGLGIAMLHNDIVKNYIAKGELVELLENYRQPQQPIYLYFKKMQYTQPKIRAFIDFVIEIIAK